MSERELLEELCSLLGSGKVDNSYLLPALRELSARAPKARALPEVIASLRAVPGSAMENLGRHLRLRCVAEASRAYQHKRSGGSLAEFREVLGDLPLDAPAGWTSAAAGVESLKLALAALRECAFLDRRPEPLPRLRKLVAERLAPLLAQGGGLIDPGPLLERLSREAADAGTRSDLEGLAALVERRCVAEATAGPSNEASGDDAADALLAMAAVSPDERRRALDLACAWPTSRMAPVIRRLVAEDPSLRERANLLLILRFGDATARDWDDWSRWLARAAEQDEPAWEEYRRLEREHAAELALLWSLGRPWVPDAARKALESLCAAAAPAVDASHISRRYGGALTDEERRSLGVAPAEATPRAKLAAKAMERPAAPPLPEPPPPEPGPSLWDDHVLPFFTANWTMLTGIAMVVVGSSLLAFYTWDKHWLLRYTILPLLLSGLTAALARIGDWIEARDAKLKPTADMLRGAAVALLPANFMAVALLARDPQVPAKPLVLGAFTAVYLLVAGAALSRWCAAVHPALSRLGRSLLLIDSLVLLGPLAALADPSGAWVGAGLALGFYAAFALLAASVVRFLVRDLTPSMIEEGRVPWFFGLTLAATFAQVFVWVHGFMRHSPSPAAYACMVIGAGALVLFTERSPLIRKPEDPVYGKNSFMGYALVLLGLLMGAKDPHLRSVSLAFAGAVWLGQAVVHEDVLHGWLAFTLLALGGATAALWPGFPAAMLPALVLGLSLAAGSAAPAAGRLWSGLPKVSLGLQSILAVAAGVAAALAQAHYHSPPLQAAGVLAAAAAILFWRGLADEEADRVLAGAAALAVALPYLGFADVGGRSLTGNNVVFGLGALSALWLGILKAAPQPTLLKARSAVVLVWGSLGTAALALRVHFERGLPGTSVLDGTLALGGTGLMVAALAAAAYHSRSLLPMILAGAQFAVLLPELKEEITARLPFIEWGSGLASAVVAAALAAACYPLRESGALKDLEGGDVWPDGRPFPLERRDHVLFTGPLLAFAAFLLVKVDTWNLWRQLDSAGLKTALGLVVAGGGWHLVASYFRAEAGAKALVHVGWLSAVAGLLLGYGLLPGPIELVDAAMLAMLGLDAMFLAYRFGLAPSRPWAADLLAEPVRDVLRGLSVLYSLASLLLLVAFSSAPALAPFMLLTGVHLAWFGLADGHRVHGALLWTTACAWVAAWAVPGLPSLDLAAPPWALLALVAGASLLQAALEAYPEGEEKLRPLLGPIWFCHALTVTALGLGLVSGATGGADPGWARQAAVLALTLAAARAHGCGPLALLGLLVGYVGLCGPALLSPWRLSALALAAAALARAGTWASERWPRLADASSPEDPLRAPAAALFDGTAALVAILATLQHFFEPALRSSAPQLGAPYLSAAALALVAAGTGGFGPLAWLAAGFATLGNVHAVRLFLGPELRAHGLLENHLLCLGAAASLAQARVAVLALSGEAATRFFNRAGLLLSGGILAALTSTYFLQPGLERMSAARFLASGAMAWLAGRAFHRAARNPDPGEESSTAVWEGCYHLALATALWCLALLFPPLRTPYAAFPALALPAAYFYLRAELGGKKDDTAMRYRDSAAALSFLLLILYAFRAAFQAVLFPGAPVGEEHYLVNAPFVMVLSLAMLRLHGLGATPWLAFYAGPAMMAGSFFSLACAPGLSPFTDPIPAAWCAIALGHFWMLASSQPSPVMSALQRLGNVNDEQWERHRRGWGLFLLASTQAALAWGIADHASDPFMVAPLLLGGASLLVHQAVIRNSSELWRFASWEAFAALHAGFVVASLLPVRWTAWAVLGLWAAYQLAARSSPDGLAGSGIGKVSKLAAGLVFLQVLRLGPGTAEGLAAFAALALLAAWTPVASFAPQAEAAASARLLVAAPLWLAFFAGARHGGVSASLALSAGLLGLGGLARWVEERAPNVGGYSPKLYHQAWGQLAEGGRGLNSRLLPFALAAALAAQWLRPAAALAPAVLAFAAALHLALAWAFLREGRLRETPAPFLGLEASLAALALLLRRELQLRLGWWNHEFDVWAGLLASTVLTGAKQAFPLAPAGARAPLMGTLLALPALTLAWALHRGLGPDVVLLVLGLQTLLFSYLGKDEKESPYQLVAVAGAVAFVLVAFWSKLGLRVAHAYVIPVGLGILTLLHLFRDRVAVDTRNQVRAFTLLAMLGSSGWYAIVDERFPLAFHLTMLGLAVFSMAVGSLLKIRLYVLLGFAGLLTDLAALVYKVLMHLDRSARMTLIGGQVLAFGAILIVGAVLYKTHQDSVDEWLARWRGELLSWE